MYLFWATFVLKGTSFLFKKRMKALSLASGTVFSFLCRMCAYVLYTAYDRGRHVSVPWRTTPSQNMKHAGRWPCWTESGKRWPPSMGAKRTGKPANGCRRLAVAPSLRKREHPFSAKVRCAYPSIDGLGSVDCSEAHARGRSLKLASSMPCSSSQARSSALVMQSRSIGRQVVKLVRRKRSASA